MGRRVQLPVRQPGERLSPPHLVQPTRSRILVFGKPQFRLDRGNDVIQELAPDETAQASTASLRQYDAGMTLIAERCCSPGQVVCDPLLLGRAATALAARQHGCVFIGVDEHPSPIDLVQSRLAEEGGGRAAGAQLLPREP